MLISPNAQFVVKFPLSDRTIKGGRSGAIVGIFQTAGGSVSQPPRSKILTYSNSSWPKAWGNFG